MMVNGQIISQNEEMTGTKKCWNFSGLIKGKNWIGITCISPGSTTAASPRIEINDDMSNQVFDI